MNRRQFLLAGAGSAVALAGCATRKSALDGATASIRTESPELQARKLAVLEAANHHQRGASTPQEHSRQAGGVLHG